MIDESVLDKIFPVPAQDDLRDEIINELVEENFVVSNFKSGGIYYTIIMIIVRIRIELIKMARNMLNNGFISHAEDVWLDLKAADFSKIRKEALKTKGYLTLTRIENAETVPIPKGTVFKTPIDINGDELRFVLVENVILPEKETKVKILVEAEEVGAIYNVPAGQISKCLIHIESVDKIENEANWIFREGSDEEDDNSFTSRTLNSWSELSTHAIADKYKNTAESVAGVLYCRVDDNYPRGQGTIDIIVTSVTGSASEDLLAAVLGEVNKIKGAYDNLLVKSSMTVTQNVNVAVTVSDGLYTDGLESTVASVIHEQFKITKDRKLNEMIQADIIYAVKKSIPALKNIRIMEPVSDVFLDTDKVIILGDVNVTVIKEL